MRFLVYGNDWENALGQMCVRAVKSLGHEVVIVDDISGSWIPFFRNRRAESCNRRLLEQARRFEPDITLVLKGSELDSETLSEVRRQTTIALVNWYPDDPFETHSEPDRDEGFLRTVSEYDIVFIWSRQLFSELEREGASRVEFLPFARDPSLHYPADAVDKFDCDVIFVGGWGVARESQLKELTDMDLQIYGDAWRWRCFDLRLQRCICGGTLSGTRYTQAMSSAKIVVNILRDQNVNASGHNMRTFEAPATGSMMVTTRTSGQDEFLPEGDSSAMYEDPAEFRETVIYYLENEDERDRIANNGKERVMDETYTARVTTIVDLVT